MSAYGTLHSVPSFLKGGAGVVCIIHRTHVIYFFYDKWNAKPLSCPAVGNIHKISSSLHIFVSLYQTNFSLY